MNDNTKANLVTCGVCLLVGAIAATIEVGKAIVKDKHRAKRMNPNAHKLTEHVSYTIIPDDIKA